MNNRSDQEPDDMTNRLQQGPGPRREDEQTVYGEANPLPPQAEPQMVRLQLPTYRAWLWRVLLALNIVIFAVPFLLDLIGFRVEGFPISAVVRALGAKSNEAIRLGGEYYRFLTSMFLHGSILHIAFNAYSLFALGPETERMYGTPRFAALYFISGFAGGVASYAFSPFPSVGASGAIFGLVGGLAAFFYASRKTLGEMARQQLGGLITVIMLNLFIGFSGTNIDNFAHIGGLVGGAAVGWLLAPRFEIDDRLYPPAVVRRFLPIGWVGAVGVLVLLVILVLAVIVPPVLSNR
jgi:rhomboid protease GluP